MRTPIFPALACLVIGLAVRAPLARAKAAEPPADLLLCPNSPIENHALFKKAAAESDPGRLEKIKIQFLILRVRHSPYTFIRNGESFKGSRASIHLAWKYARRSEGITCAEDFIAKVGSGSALSGEPYLLKTPRGEEYLLGGILENELHSFDAHLRLAKSAVALEKS